VIDCDPCDSCDTCDEPRDILGLLLGFGFRYVALARSFARVVCFIVTS
jgi:hypothetical protein